MDQLQLGITKEYDTEIIIGFEDALKTDSFDFFVIYSFDIPYSESVGPHKPCNVKLWDQTEDDSGYDYDYLEGEWSKGKHRKYCARLTLDQFKEFVEDQYLYPEDIETGGSLTGFGWLPAISFDYDAGYDPVIKNAYVTPILKHITEDEDIQGMTEGHWQRVRTRVFEIFDS